MTRLKTIAVLSVALLLASPVLPTSSAGWFGIGRCRAKPTHHHKRPACRPVVLQSRPCSAPAFMPSSQPSLSAPAPQQAVAAPDAAQPVYQYGDPYGFTAWLNGVRAQNGRRAVGYDANLSAWAAANNGQQNARGMGHFVMGSARRQNSGTGGAQAVWSMWMASPAHQAALVDPTITMIGIAASGSYWTFNAY